MRNAKFIGNGYKLKTEKMVESVVSFLVNKLAPLIAEEGKLLRGVREEVKYIKNELECMKAFLRVADGIEDSDPEIDTWVKQVRDVAYDTEDVLDEFMLRLKKHRGHGGFYASLGKISCSVKNLKARHWVASEIKSIKSRVYDISEGQRRYHRRGDAVLDQSSSSSTAQNTWYNRREDALLLDEAELVGVDEPKRQLIRWLVEGESRLKVVSVVGMGGLGKTTLVKKVYDDSEVRKHFQNHAWITVSRSFKLEELLRDMIRQLFKEMKQTVPEGVETLNSRRLKAIINDFLRENRYVLVLDDVWSIRDWDDFKYAFPNTNCGSRVLLTTRDEEVASTSRKETQGYVYEMKPLSQDDSWNLFCRRTFSMNFCPSPLVELSRSVLKRCKGLPLAIVALSGVLATKENDRIDEWEMVCRSRGVDLEGHDRVKSMEKILLLNYNDLPYYLKSCFLYLSIFPEDHLIERMRLIRLWIAEGFVEEKEGKTLEEVAEGYLKQLLKRSLIQVGATTRDGRVKTCRIHDLLREIILSKSTDQDFVAIANEQNTRWPEKVRRLSVHYSWKNVPENSNFSQLRSLLMFGVDNSLSSPSMLSLCIGLPRLLKVLDLRGAPVDAFPDEITKLFHLRYLSLRDTKVRMLPTSIGKLQNLETLDVKNAYVTELPVEILELRRLRHLLVYHDNITPCLPFYFVQGFKAAPAIGALQSLQKLCYIEANQSGGNLMAEIGKLIQLRRLGIIKSKREDGVTFCSSIEKLSNLRSLSISSVGEDEIIDLQHLSTPPRFLQRLYLQGCLEKLPHWIPSLQSLVKLRLGWSRLKDDPLESLGVLPNLVELRLIQAYDGETLCSMVGMFQRLKYLKLDGCKGLKVVRVEEGSMPNLEELIIDRCKLLERVPLGIEHLAKLDYLGLGDMPDELIETLKPDREGGDYWKIAHIRKVFIGYVKDGRWTGCHLLR